MAIGARITSNNLSGKTATVTFVPYTGSTSGSTVNLGTQTIPFNNITSHPYGVYSLYFSEYDYTYTLTINEPNSHTYTLMAQLSGNTTNVGAGVLNFSDLTTSVLDFGLDGNVWNFNDLYPTNNYGYMYGLYNNNDSTVQFIFTNSANAEIGRYSGTTNSYNTYVLDGNWVLVNDSYTGICTYSNGENVYTYTYDPSYQELNIEWNNYATTSTKSMIFILHNTNTNESSTFIISDSGLAIPLDTWDPNVINKQYSQSPTHNFIVSIDYSNNTNTYQTLKIRSTSGTELQSVNISGYNDYDNYNWRQYGENRFCIVLWNNANVDTQYLIIHYDANIDSLITSTRTRGNDYMSLYFNASDKFGLNDEGHESIFLIFYHDNGYSNIGTIVSTCDIVYMLGNQTSFNTYTFEDGNTAGTKAINLWYGRGKSYIAPFADDLNTGNVKLLTINENGVNTIDTGVLYNSNDFNYWSYRMGFENAFLFFTPGNYAEANLIIIKTDNTTITQQMQSNNGNWGFIVSVVTDILYISDYTNAWYYTRNSGTLNSISGVYNNSENTYFETGTGYIEPIIFVYNNTTSTPVGRIITSSGISNELAFPTHNGIYTFRLGKNKLLYGYADNNTGMATFKLYDSSLNLLNTLTTNYNNGWWEETQVANDRFVVIIRDSGLYTVYMITENVTKSLVMSDNKNRYTANNDYLNWND